MSTKTHPIGWGELPEDFTLADLLMVEDQQDWQERALCAQTDPEAFFPEIGESTMWAKRICLSCEVKDECLEYALERNERFGIWGGLSDRERRKMKKRGVLTPPPPSPKRVQREQRNERIRQLRQAGLSVPEVALMVGVSTKTVVRAAPMSRRERKVA